MATSDQKSEILEAFLSRMHKAFSKKAGKGLSSSSYKGHKRRTPKK